MLLHATCVAIDGCGVLLTGASGAGKSDLALRLITSGAMLVADDQVILETAANGDLVASPPDTISGLIEARHVGIMRLPFVSPVPITLCVELTAAAVMDATVERLPMPCQCTIGNHHLRQLQLPSFAASTVAKIILAVRPSTIFLI